MSGEIIFEKRRRRKRKLMIAENKVIFRKRLEHVFELPPDIAEWAKKNVDLLDWLIFDSPISSALRHPHSVRTLMYLLYARAQEIPIAQIAKRLDIAHEQLYRLERLLAKVGLKDTIYTLIKTRTAKGEQ